MLFLVQNRILTINRAKTYLTASAAVAGTTLTVKGVDSNQWANNDWIIVGEIGTPNAEIMQINGAVSDGTSLTVDNAGSGGLRFAHSVDEPVYRIDYNQMKVFHASTEEGAKTTLATVEVQPESFESRYEDKLNTSGYGFVRFYNTQTGAVSPYSDAIPYTGQSARSLAKMIQKVRMLCDEQDDDFISDSQINAAINDKQRDILNERLWTFNEVVYSTSTIENQFQYDKPSTIKTLHTVRVKTEPLAKISQAQWEMYNWNTNTSSTNPTTCSIWSEKVMMYPRPAADAANTNLSAAINDTVTDIEVDDATGFTLGDFYRFIIDDEVIYATAMTVNGSPATSYTFTGCLRAQEGTTAASHLDNATVTERDIVYTGQAEPEDLVELNDLTPIPEALVVCYGVAADFCNGKLQKPTLGDRYELKYKDGIKSLEDKYTLKLTSQFGRVKDPRELITDNSYIGNPNQYPQNVIAPPLTP